MTLDRETVHELLINEMVTKRVPIQALDRDLLRVTEVHGVIQIWFMEDIPRCLSTHTDSLTALLAEPGREFFATSRRVMVTVLDKNHLAWQLSRDDLLLRLIHSATVDWKASAGREYTYFVENGTLPSGKASHHHHLPLNRKG